MNVGIDLGTTNSALAYIDEVEASEADYPPIHVLPVEQRVDANHSTALRTLPSFVFLDDPPVVGALAREQSALLPARTVHSAKSWLANPEAERSAKLLPWDAGEEGRVMSPVEASTLYLQTLAGAWERAKGSSLASHKVVLTVPASFDEEARELTIKAAQDAGLEQLTLLEEPAAAFYSWIAGHLSKSNRELFDGETVLVCDVGGGTSDFTLVRVARTGDRVEFTRTHVGKHLLLGGDNFDLTLSWLAESKLGKQLSLRQRSALRRQCSSAKERLLAVDGPTSVEINVAASGSSLIGGSSKATLSRDEAIELAMSGFLPPCQLTDASSQERGSVFRELGLPYVSDPAITRHLAEFLRHSPAVETGIDAILFNGGFFIPQLFRDRIRDVVHHWFGREPAVFENTDLDLAVAMGAAYYSYVRASGSGVLVRGGLPRAYFIGLERSGSEAVEAVCLMPRGTEEGTEIALERPELEVLANTPVAFRLYSSLERTEDAAGDVVSFAKTSSDLIDPQSEPRLHAPLQATIRFGRGGARRVPVTLGARLSELGTMEAWAQSKVSEHRWRLQFQLRRNASGQERANVNATSGLVAGSEAILSPETVERAKQLLTDVFGPGTSPMVAPEELPSRLESALGLGRLSWPLAALRGFADHLLSLAEGRRRSAAHEVRWLNLTGFCVRPGIGYPGDELRVEQGRRIYASGLVFANQTQNQIDWWIFCGRIAAGLNRNQQADLYQRIAAVLLPKGGKRQGRVNQSLYREMWRTAASLELLPQQTRVQMGDALLALAKRGEMQQAAFWCLSRLGARQLFHAPINLVISPQIAGRWIESLLRLPHTPSLLEAAVQMARVTGDGARDVPAALIDQVRRLCEGSARAPALLRVLAGEMNAEDNSRIFGEELPTGLSLSSAHV